MKKFNMPKKTDKEAINRSIRIPKSLAEKVDKVLGNECSFSAFAVESIKFALENMKKKK